MRRSNAGVGPTKPIMVPSGRHRLMCPPMNRALELARHGHQVVPVYPSRGGCCTCGTQCGKTGTHPRVNGWMEQATTDPETIYWWWATWPDAVVGLVGRRDRKLYLPMRPTLARKKFKNYRKQPSRRV